MVLVTRRGTARLQTTDAARQYQTASVRNATDPAPLRVGHAVVLCWVPVEVQTPAPDALSTAYLHHRRGLRAHGQSLLALPRTPLHRGIGTRPEDRPPVQRGVHAVRAVGSAQLVVGFVRGERRGRGVARRRSRRCRPIGENSDYQISTPSPRRIRARILTQRCRGAGAVLFAARRGAATTTSHPPLLVATACLALAAAASATALTRNW